MNDVQDQDEDEDEDEDEDGEREPACLMQWRRCMFLRPARRNGMMPLSHYGIEEDMPC